MQSQILVPALKSVECIDRLFKLVGGIPQLVGSVEFDLSSVDLITPDGVIALTLAIRELERLNIEISLTNLDTNVAAYLERVDFFSRVASNCRLPVAVSVKVVVA